MSTLAVVEAILREAAMPLSVREIVERAGDALPTRSKTPDTVVARDLSMDIKRRSDGSTFVRTSPGRYAIRELAQAQGRDADDQTAEATESAPLAPAITTATAPVSPIAPIAPQTLSDSSVPTPLVGQSLPHDRNGTRPAPTKPQTNSEDTPMSA